MSRVLSLEMHGVEKKTKEQVLREVLRETVAALDTPKGQEG